MVLHGIACYCIVLHGITYHCMVLHGIAWYGMVSHVIAWFFMFSSYFILSSRDDETQQMKLVWNMRLEKMENTGAPVFKVKQDPNMQMIELSEGPAVDKTGEKVQRCTKCRRPKKGHALPVGKNCKYASN